LASKLIVTFIVAFRSAKRKLFAERKATMGATTVRLFRAAMGKNAAGRWLTIAREFDDLTRRTL
jgi:hypothetical protein